jgi:hypothetical protein
MAAIAGKSAKIRTTSILTTSSTDNAATITTGAGTGVSSVQIDATGRRHWDRGSTATPSLYLNSTLVPSSDIASINPVQGVITLDNSRTSTGTWTIDMRFLTTTYLAGGKSWDLDWDTNMYDTTAFSTTTGNVQWRTFVPGLSGGSVSISRLTSTGGTTGPLVYDHMNLQNDVVVELVTDAANHYEAYGWYDSLGVTADIDSLTVESIDITIDGDLYFSTT